MSPSKLRRGLLSLVFGLGFLAGTAWADDRPVGVPAIVSEVSSEDDAAAAKKSGWRSGGGLKERWKNRTPILCYGHFNDYSCGSLHSDLQFLFGSCRSFYGEACIKGPPPSPVPGFDPREFGLERTGKSGRCPNCR